MQAMTSTNDDTTPFGARLWKARAWTQQSREAFAEILGLSAGSVENYEKGIRMPPTNITVQWAQLTGASLTWLLSAPDLSGPNQGHPLVVIEGGKTSGSRPRPPVCPVEQAA